MARHASLIVFLMVLPLIVGCDGCRPGPQPDPGAQDGAEPPKEAYSTESAVIYPNDQSASFGAVKPGHWMTAGQSIRSNIADMQGELISRGTVFRRDANNEQIGTIESLETMRPVVLPKGQMRRFDYRFRCPIPNSVGTRRISLSSRMVPRSGAVLPIGAQPFNVMNGSEYFFVVLTKRPDQFTRLQVADWVRSASDQLDNPVDSVNYRVVVPDADGLLSLPETMLDYSSIAAVLWDDLSEDALTPSQQSALADWVRFGGRMIVNGPDASDALVNTMLADLLPLVPTSNIELDPDAASELLRDHSVASDRSLKKQLEYVRSENSRIAVDGRLSKGAIALENTASLVLLKRVGGGTVVQPRFDLTDGWIEDWDSYDSFINSVILNRPPREYVTGNASDSEVDGVLTDELRLYFAGTRVRADAAVNTQFRIASRDSVIDRAAAEPSKKDSLFDSYTRNNAVTGIAAWNSNSDLISAMRDTLAMEAGIEIPDSSLVVRALTIYLIVLVPINYLIFRLLNRLEYAWFAVPIIAILGAALAAREARLDIGFARSNTELAVMETHAGYARGHLTRVVGVYNSLSSRYEMRFPTVDGIASPFDDEPFPGTSVRPVLRVSYEEGPILSDFAVPSNRMRYLHSEELIDLGGGIEFENGQTLTSNTDLELLDVIVIRKTKDGECESAVVGTLTPGASVTLDFRQTDAPQVAEDLPLHVEKLLTPLAQPNNIPPGSCRLLARIDGRLEGVEIRPTASQQAGQTIVLIHLEYPEMRAIAPDKNLVSDFRRVNRLESSENAPEDSPEQQGDDAATSAKD